MAANSNPTAKRRRGPGRPFPPGTSGNPNGRPKGFSTLIRERTKEGLELVDFAQAVMRAETAKLLPVLPKDVSRAGKLEAHLAAIPHLRERMAAHGWLSDQGWGKAPQREEDNPLGDKPDSELEEALAKDDALMDRLVAARARLKAANAPTVGTMQ